MNLILGIDPGISGAYALFNPETKTLHASLFPLADSPTSKSKKEINCERLFHILHPDRFKIRYAVMENVHSMPGQSCVSTFRFGESFGMLKAVLQSLLIPCHFTHPNSWKPIFHLTTDKKDSVKLASKLFPTHKLKNHNQAEAALLAVYGSLYLKSLPISDSRGGVADY